MIVMIPESKDDRKKTWRRWLKSVDRTKSNGYAFEGPWLRAGERAELPVGALVLGYDEPGSMKNWYPLIRVWRVEPDGLQEVYWYEGTFRERSWALAVRDDIADLLTDSQAPAELSTEEQELVERLRALAPDRLAAVLKAAQSGDAEQLSETEA